MLKMAQKVPSWSTTRVRGMSLRSKSLESQWNILAALLIYHSVMFVDNPVGTGYSFVDTDSYVHELPDMANQFVQFLEKWFALFPEFEHDDVSYTSPMTRT